MRSVSHQLLATLPAVLALGVALLSAVPMSGGYFSYTPNVAWLVTLVMVAHFPPAWPRGLAFGLGLLQDVLFMTPLGSQALIALMLVSVTAHRNMVAQTPLFRLRWLEAAGMLIAAHLLLYVLMNIAGQHGASLQHLLRAGFVNALWFPIFYFVLTRGFAALPDAK